MYIIKFRRSAHVPVTLLRSGCFIPLPTSEGSAEVLRSYRNTEQLDAGHGHVLQRRTRLYEPRNNSNRFKWNAYADTEFCTKSDASDTAQRRTAHSAPFLYQYCFAHKRPVPWRPIVLLDMEATTLSRQSAHRWQTQAALNLWEDFWY
jgi:hypothetical protein